MAAVAGLIAHGGTAGAIVEVLLAIAAIAFFVVWLRERSARRSQAYVDLRDVDDRE